MKNLLLILFFFLMNSSFSQEKEIPQWDYNTNIHIYGGVTYMDVDVEGFGPSIGAMKEVNRWLSMGVDFSYFKNDRDIERTIIDFPGGMATITSPYVSVEQFTFTPRFQISPFRPSEKVRFFTYINPNLIHYDGLQDFETTSISENFWDVGYDLGLGFHFHNVFDERITIIPTGSYSQSFDQGKYITDGGFYPRTSLAIAYELQ